MRRKIILHGPSSLTVSLPSFWAKKYNLKKGDEIDIFERTEGLQIVPADSSNGVQNCDICFDNLTASTRKNLLFALHKKGYDQIKINFSDSTIAREINKNLTRLQLGFEIIEQNSDSVIIRNLSNPDRSQFKGLLRRLFRIAIEYFVKVSSLIDNSDDITETYLLHESSINRISNYCRRIIIKEGTDNSSLDYAVICDIEYIVSSLTLLLEEISGVNDEALNLDMKIYDSLVQQLVSIYNLKYKFSFEDYNKIRESMDNVHIAIDLHKKKSDYYFYKHFLTINKACERLLESVLTENV